MKNSAIARKAVGYLERGWCRTASARDADGQSCKAHSPDARSWCMSGAFRVAGVAKTYEGNAHFGRVDELFRDFAGHHMADYNDYECSGQQEAKEVMRDFALWLETHQEK